MKLKTIIALFFITFIHVMSNQTNTLYYTKYIHDIKYHNESAHNQNKSFDPVPLIMEHIKDSYEWHIGGRYSIPLPIILIQNKKFIIFSSKEFEEGKKIILKNGNYYCLYNNDIYLTNKNGLIKYIITKNKEIKIINPKPFNISLTKNATSMIISCFILSFIFIYISKNYKKDFKIPPKGLSCILEILIIFIRDEIAKPNIGKRYQKYLPYLLTVFFFIWINNMLGLLPGSANVTGNISVTFVLAIIGMIIINISGNKNYWKHIFWMPGVPLLVKIILAPIELSGIITKPFALMIRLFANITAGHIIILSLICLVFIFKTSLVTIGSIPLTVFIYILEISAALLQAFVFTMLMSLFIGMAVSEENSH